MLLRCLVLSLGSVYKRCVRTRKSRWYLILLCYAAISDCRPCLFRVECVGTSSGWVVFLVLRIPKPVYTAHGLYGRRRAQRLHAPKHYGFISVTDINLTRQQCHASTEHIPVVAIGRTATQPPCHYVTLHYAVVTGKRGTIGFIHNRRGRAAYVSTCAIM